MILYLVRHGRSEYNTMKRYTGSTDACLSAEGVEQAHRTAYMLKDVGFDTIVSSPLIRARKTAEIIAEYHPGIPMIFMDEFRERSFGDWEGREYYDRSYIDFICLPENIGTAPDNGEPIIDFDRRVGKGLEILSERYSDKTVLLVAHGMVSRMINRRICGLDFGEANSFLLPNCGFIKYEI